ncbi:MAG: hypothetical protein IPN40_15245 [Uliginosibacterium sp.]|nr:hypothetical protein [Uliginosibacterium sp.]
MTQLSPTWKHATQRLQQGGVERRMAFFLESPQNKPVHPIPGEYGFGILAACGLVESGDIIPARSYFGCAAETELCMNRPADDVGQPGVARDACAKCVAVAHGFGEHLPGMGVLAQPVDRGFVFRCD